MNLTEYELVDMAINVQATTTPTLAVFLTIMSGYLIVSWLAGERLTRAQVIFINVLFTFFQLGLLVGWSGRWLTFYQIASVLNSIDPTVYVTGSPVISVSFAIVMFASIPGCLKFLWDVRHPKIE